MWCSSPFSIYSILFWNSTFKSPFYKSFIFHSLLFLTCKKFQAIPINAYEKLYNNQYLIVQQIDGSLFYSYNFFSAQLILKNEKLYNNQYLIVQQIDGSLFYSYNFFSAQLILSPAFLSQISLSLCKGNSCYWLQPLWASVLCRVLEWCPGKREVQPIRKIKCLHWIRVQDMQW